MQDYQQVVQQPSISLKYGANFMKRFRLKYDLDDQKNQIVQNYIMRRLNDGHPRITKIPGTNPYNDTDINQPITWCERYYGRKEDGTFIKKTFASAGTRLYVGDDVLRALNHVKTGLSNNTRPESTVVQVAGNSRMYFFNGNDLPIYYEGNDAGTWTDSSITLRFVQGVVKDDRLWAFESNTSTLYFSATLNPEDFSTLGGSITIGNEKDSFIRRLSLIGNYLYIFKNDSIYVLRGNTKATYSVDIVNPSTGLIAQKALARVDNDLVFISQQDKQVYFFSGGYGLKKVSGEGHRLDFAKAVNQVKTDNIVCEWDRRNNIFRISYEGFHARENYNNHESIFPTDQGAPDGKLKWSTTYGARISCYSMWDRQGDNTLVTGRSDIGKLMYHNRGQDWDGLPMETILKTQIISKDGINLQFNRIILKGKPSTGVITVRYSLNDRTDEADRGSNNLADLGEEATIESLSYKIQEKFLSPFPLLTGKNYGDSITFSIYDNTVNKEIELEYLLIDMTQRATVKTSLIGG